MTERQVLMSTGPTGPQPHHDACRQSTPEELRAVEVARQRKIADGWSWNPGTHEWWLYRDGEVRERVSLEAWGDYRRYCELTIGGIPL